MIFGQESQAIAEAQYMREDVIDIRNRIKNGEFPSEAAVSQGIGLRILERLSWPTYDTNIVAPQYPLEEGRVDFALCHPERKPIAFIEVKRIGLIGHNGNADLQLFKYAFHRGVPMAILTDGPEWHFFLPAERGAYDERRVYKLDLLEREPDESVFRLRRYLDYQAVRSGRAFEAARTDYRDIAKEREIQRALPDAWRRLIEDGDEILLELVADKVESLCGYKPDPETVAEFFLEGRSPMRSSPPHWSCPATVDTRSLGTRCS